MLAHRSLYRTCTTALLTTALAIAPALHADSNAATDDIPRLIPYSGQLEKDGEAVSGQVKMVFTLYDADNVVWTEAQNVGVYRGRFSVTLGVCSTVSDVGLCPDGELAAAPIEAALQAADDLELAIELETADGTVVLTQRKRLLPQAYALWSPAAADLRVHHDLQVDGAATVDGALSAGSVSTSGAISSGSLATSLISMSHGGTSTSFRGFRTSVHEASAGHGQAITTDSGIPENDAICMLSKHEFWGSGYIHMRCNAYPTNGTWKVYADALVGSTDAHALCQMRCLRWNW
jgi:hypothetical protein